MWESPESVFRRSRLVDCGIQEDRLTLNDDFSFFSLLWLRETVVFFVKDSDVSNLGFSNPGPSNSSFSLKVKIG